MPLPRALLLTTLVTVPPSYYVYHTITRLEAQYPRLPPESTSTPALRTPQNPKTQHTPYVDIYGARVPLKALLHQASRDGLQAPRPTTQPWYVEETWARFFLQSSTLKAEGKMFGGFSRRPGDCGEAGFRTSQVLLNGGFVVLRPPSRAAPLLVQWTFPPGLEQLCRRAAEWGYPWRFMSGGRHEFSVGEVDKDGMVEVRFASAHDYEWVREEGEKQKMVPEWTARLHRAFAIWLLDERVRKLREEAEKDL